MYAPQSPDLSGFFSSTPKSQQPYHPNSNSNSNPPSTSSYAPRSPSIPNDPPSQFTHGHNPNAYQHTYPHNQPAFVNNTFEYDNNQYMPIPDLPAAHSFGDANLSSAAPYYPPQQNQFQSHPSQFKAEPSFDQEYHPSPTMSSRGPRIKNDPALAQPSTYKDPNPNNIEIKTKFPVARIKRIMQADEEVGKVAQVTPVAVSKALELFMIALVGGAAEIAKEKGQKRVTAQHLKAVVLGSDQFDFLTDIVGRVTDVQEGAGGEKKRKEKAQAESDSSEEGKKPKKGRGRRKKNDD